MASAPRTPLAKERTRIEQRSSRPRPTSTRRRGPSHGPTAAETHLDRDRLECGPVVEIQRARLLAATGEIACEHGAANVAVTRIVQRAGVSRRTFYELFVDGEDCLLAALRDALERVGRCVLPAWGAQGSWREQVRGALVELLRFFDEEPVLAQLLVVESLGVSHRVLEHRSHVLAGLVEAIDEARRGTRPAATATQLSAEGAIGGVLAVLHTRISRQETGSLTELTGPLMGMLVLPYQGSAAARRELERPAPRPARSRKRVHTDPIKDAGMRLTYRTVRVLGAIAEHPGSSNRAVAGHAGMSDQGQISKLLSRLERLGLVANNSESQHRGEPNVWTLTPAGQRVTNSMRVDGDSRNGS